MIDNDGRQQLNRNTSLPLILLTLIVGVALGWLLHDIIRGPATPVAAPAARPTAGVQQPTATMLHATQLAPIQRSPTAESAGPLPAPLATATAAPAPTAGAAVPTEVSPPPQPTAAPQITGYAGHVVAPGETLEQIAAQGGSTPALIAGYNLLDGAPQAGRALIVPRLAGRTSSLASEPILVRHGREDKPWVALTLDAGAGAEPVPSILKTLREHRVKITFFLTGKWIEENPDLARQIAADGHEIANHTVNHPDLRNLDDTSIRKELAGTEQLVAQTTGATSRPFFRPPFGAYDERVLNIAEGAGYLPVYWTLDSLDSVGEPKTAEFLVERVTGKLTPQQLHGAIILAHCGSAPTAEALPAILDRFAAMGLEVRRLSDVLSG